MYVAEESSDIAPYVPGRVIATPVDAGDFVRQGQVIAADCVNAPLDFMAVKNALAKGQNIPADAAADPAGLVTATDVLNYTGPLPPVLAAVHKALEPGGLFGFSLEVDAIDGKTARP